RPASISATGFTTHDPIGSGPSPAPSSRHGPRAPILVWRNLSLRTIFGPTSRNERRRCMTRSPANPRPVRTGRYRYSKLRWGLLRAVWDLGRSIRSEGYDLGIDVRGDVLSVLVLALGGVPRRVGWAMGGGAFLLTDIAHWVRGRHEVRSRLALLEALGITT